jgi:hypothetical protein
MAEGPDAALRAVAAPGFDASRQVVLEERPSIANAAGSPSTSGEAAYRADGPQAATIDVVASAPATVLIRNAWDPNWHATVDGAPAKVLVADSVVQAVAVPAGRHRIRLAYHDPTIGFGALASALALVVMAILAGAALWAERRRATAVRPA